jgi:hypothetical protein
MPKQPATVETIMESLYRRPSLLYDVLKHVLKRGRRGEWKVAGGWDGPHQHEGGGKIIEFHQRQDPLGDIVATVKRRIDTQPLPPWSWHTKNEQEGVADTPDQARMAADTMLERMGWTIVNGPPCIAGPWVQKTNHWCREMLSGSLRNKRQNNKIAVIREQSVLHQLAWGVLDRADPGKTIQTGSVDTTGPVGAEDRHLKEAMVQADKALRDLGWLLFEEGGDG